MHVIGGFMPVMPERFWLVGSPGLRGPVDWKLDDGDLLVFLGNVFADDAWSDGDIVAAIECQKVLIFGDRERKARSQWWIGADFLALSNEPIAVCTELPLSQKTVSFTMSAAPVQVEHGFNIYGSRTEYNPAGIRVGPRPVRLADVLRQRSLKIGGN